jgi:hypothetical protein
VRSKKIQDGRKADADEVTRLASYKGSFGLSSEMLFKMFESGKKLLLTLVAISSEHT